VFSYERGSPVGKFAEGEFLWLGLHYTFPYLTESGNRVVSQNFIAAQIRQHVLSMSDNEG
jgi:hypothetical protein